MVLLGVPSGVTTAALQQACETSFGKVTRVHRPSLEATPFGEPRCVDPSSVDGNHDFASEDDSSNDASSKDSQASHEPFAFVEFEDDLSAHRAVGVGFLEFFFGDTPGPVRTGDGPVDQVPANQPERGHTLQVVSRKHLTSDVSKWRAAVRTRFAGETELRIPTRNVGPSDDPTEWCNAGNNFRKTFPELVRKAA